MLWHALQCTGDGFGWFALSALCSVQMCTVKCAVCRCAVCTVCTSQCVQCAVQSAAAAALFLVCRGGAVKRRGEGASGCQSLSRSHLQVRFSHLQARLRGELADQQQSHNCNSSRSRSSLKFSIFVFVFLSLDLSISLPWPASAYGIPPRERKSQASKDICFKEFESRNRLLRHSVTQIKMDWICSIQF